MSTPAQRLGGLGALGKFSDLKQRLLFVVGALIVYRIGTYIPVPGINPSQLAKLFSGQQDSIVGLFNMFSGGALERFSLFALGIMPYISSSIIMQLMSSVIPSLEQLKKEGESGRRKITQYTRYGTVILATVQALGIAIAFEVQGAAVAPGIGFKLMTVVSLVTGTMFLMWLGEQITERGLGNGISLIIFAGIVAGLPSAVASTLGAVATGSFHTLKAIGLFGIVVAVTWFVVLMERAQRRITVNYAKRQQGRQMLAGGTSHLPLKINMAGVIPPIFASSIILLPTTVASWFGEAQGMQWLRDLATKLGPGEPTYVLLYATGIVFFCFFYTALVFNPKETADNLKKSGAFIPGIRPGDQTASYVDGVMTRLTFWGAMYITAVCLLPEFLRINWKVQFYFGGTSLLIVVVVCMDFMAQIQTRLMSHQYESLLRKANLTGGGMGLPR
ncbi:MAG: preprotein translocase subunit SecY [Candidatus Muproteobacteria bacterium RBG_16_62_13]|uniref:Protein translocase subunit SecY n=1 Tax=Candidatus Muproteobacteria bacterium RBG_16_62_13 TaxID=1817756 RepID=A0A1F6T7R3_9PROT|nr:MAG: preprotein translocase subunit SecY [Candidatus Muproteobacteria bacterium RBG_16_62_13]